MKPQQAALRRTAYHEAGHVVAAIKLGIRFKKATIVPDGDSMGALHHHALGFDPVLDGSDRARLRIERHAIICLAGHEAERRFTGRSIRRGGAASDYWRFCHFMSCITGSDQELNAYARLLMIRTRDLLAIFWPSVEAVAGALLERRTLSQAEALDAFRAPSRRATPP